MAKPRHKRPNPDGVSPFSGFAPPKHTRFKPGQSGNPSGRPSAGLTIREWINQLAAAELTEADLRRIARDKQAPWPRRAAAERILRTLESGDLADMEGVLDGAERLSDLRERGINTEVVKKMKVKTRTTDDGAMEVEREVELHDRSGTDFDRIIDRTLGKAAQTIDVTTEGKSLSFSLVVATPNDVPDPDPNPAEAG